MDQARPRPRPATVTEQPPHSRAEMVRFFAWGYLSRRELNERLKAIESLDTAEAMHTPAA